MRCAAMPKKCARFCHCTCRWSTSSTLGIVDQGGRLQCVTGTFAAEIIVSQPTKLFIYSVHESVSSVLIPRAPLDEPPCDV